MLTSIYKRKGRTGVTLAHEDPKTGKVRQKQFPTRALAIVFRDRIRAAAREPVNAAPDVTFPEYARRWLRATKTAVRAGTYRNYESNVRVHLVEAFPGKLAEITHSQVRDFIVQMREGGRKKKYASNVRGALHACLEAAVEEGILTANPAHFRSKSKLLRLTTTPGERRGKVKAFNVDQARAFFDVAPAVAPLHHMLWRTMVATGLRPGEGAGLQPADLDYAGNRIRLERAITRGRVEPCKTNAQGEHEDVDMPKGLAEELRAWEAARMAEALSCARPRSAWLFPSSTGGTIDEKGSADAFKRVLKKAGLPHHFSPHSLRHTYASQQLDAGESIYYVQRQLRHADVSMTIGTYGSWLPKGNRAVADRHYERLFGGAMSQSSHKR